MDEEVTTTRLKYTWLDAFAFVGGIIDLIFIMLSLFFSIYNYGVYRYDVFYHFEKKKALKKGKSHTVFSKTMSKYQSTIGFRLFLHDSKKYILDIFPCL